MSMLNHSIGESIFHLWGCKRLTTVLSDIWWRHTKQLELLNAPFGSLTYLQPRGCFSLQECRRSNRSSYPSVSEIPLTNVISRELA